MAEAEAELEDLFGGSDSDDSGGDNAKAKPGSAQEQLEDEDAAGLEDDVPEPKQGGSSGKAAGASLFGSDSDDDDDDDDAPKQEKPSGAKGGLAISAAQRQQQQQRATPGSDDGEDEERGARGRRQPVAVGPPLDVACTLVPVPAPGSLLLLRTTNIMSIQPRAFDPANFELEQEEYEDSSGKVRVRLASSAVVRWRSRRLPDGREVRESNARLVRWEDGSVQLLLGEEVLDVAQQDMRANAQYLFKQTDGLLQGQGALTTKVALRPASLDSGLHKRLREVVDKKHGVKKDKVVIAKGLANPELENKRKEAAVEEKIRGRTQLARRQDKSLRAYGGSARGSRPSRLSNQYLEEEQEWEGGGGGGGAYDIYDDELTADQRARLSLQQRNRTLGDDRAEADMGRRLQAAKRGGPTTRSDERYGGRRARRQGSDDEEEEEEEEEEVGDEEDDEEDEPEYESSGEEEDEEEERGGGGEPAPKKARTVPEPKAPEPKVAAKPRRRGVVLSDDEDD